MSIEYIKEIKEEQFKDYKNGIYFFKYDPKILWEFWPPDDEEVFFFKGHSRSVNSPIWMANHIHCNATFIREFTNFEERLLNDQIRENRCECGGVK